MIRRWIAHVVEGVRRNTKVRCPLIRPSSSRSRSHTRLRLLKNSRSLAGCLDRCRSIGHLREKDMSDQFKSITRLSICVMDNCYPKVAIQHGNQLETKIRERISFWESPLFGDSKLGNVSQLNNERSSNWIYPGESYFLKKYEIKIGSIVPV